MADLPVDLAPDAAARLAAALDVEGKMVRGLEALGPVAGQDVVLIDAAGGLRARGLAELGARLTLVERDAARVAGLSERIADLPGVMVHEGSSLALPLADASADRIVSCWSAFREDLPRETAEADRVLRPEGRLLVVHDYGRDDVSRLRGPDLPEYGAWSRRDGWFLRNGFKMRVLHCWWTFASMDEMAAFLEQAFGSVGADVFGTLKRPRLSYNVAIYHRARGASGASAEVAVGATAA